MLVLESSICTGESIQLEGKCFFFSSALPLVLLLIPSRPCLDVLVIQPRRIRSTRYLGLCSLQGAQVLHGARHTAPELPLAVALCGALQNAG